MLKYTITYDTNVKIKQILCVDWIIYMIIEIIYNLLPPVRDQYYKLM